MCLFTGRGGQCVRDVGNLLVRNLGETSFSKSREKVRFHPVLVVFLRRQSLRRNVLGFEQLIRLFERERALTGWVSRPPISDQAPCDAHRQASSQETGRS